MLGRVAYMACVAGMISTSAAQAQEGCWRPQELRSAKVRDLQTMLMVGTLQCRSSSQEIVANYNRFIANNRQLLVNHNIVLKTRFMRTDGVREGARAYDSFTTRLANLHSESARAGEANFCQTTAAMAALAGTAPAADIEAMAEALAEPAARIGDVCAVATTAPVAAETGGTPATMAVVAAEPTSADQLQSATAALHAAVKALEAALAAQAQPAASLAVPVPIAADAPAVAASGATP